MFVVFVFGSCKWLWVCIVTSYREKKDNNEKYNYIGPPTIYCTQLQYYIATLIHCNLQHSFAAHLTHLLISYLSLYKIIFPSTIITIWITIWWYLIIPLTTTMIWVEHCLVYVFSVWAKKKLRKLYIWRLKINPSRVIYRWPLAMRIPSIERALETDLKTMISVYILIDL